VLNKTGWPSDLDEAVVRHARVLPLEIVQAKGAGHAGTASSLTPALYVLFQGFLRHDPAAPEWAGRDRFVLSCGHASLALYLQLWLCGYGLELDDLGRARTIDSRTPGHPERGHTPGVETTTGPLGQGVANAVGIAMEGARLERLLGTDLYSPRVWCFASDGDMEEGISHEASSLAGTLGLQKLIVVWDDNGISIEGDTSIAFGEDVEARYRAYGWHTLEIADGEDPAALRDAFTRAHELSLHGPVLVRLRTRIGHPMPTVGGTAGAHSGAPGADEVRATKELLGLDPERELYMPQHLLAHARAVADRGAHAHAEWRVREERWRSEDPDAAALLDRMRQRDVSEALAALDELRDQAQPAATRAAGAAVLERIAPLLPELWGGSADLAESNGTRISTVDSFLPMDAVSEQWPGGHGGQLVHFGIREHAMGAILNGIALGGVSRPFGATFFVFSDYMRPAVRLAALMSLPVVYVWSHDSIAVGEDGPTHQPLEHLWSYRAIPGLAVVRPADWVETVDAWRRVLADPSGPTALVLSRQKLPVVAQDIRPEEGATRGAYILRDPDGAVDAIVIATGSEVAVALGAAELLDAEGIGIRVVSAPCLEWFEQQDADYRAHVLPAHVRCRVSVEAGTDTGWHRYIGLDGRAVAVHGYGTSGAGDILLERAGITVDAVCAALRDSLREAGGAEGAQTRMVVSADSKGAGLS